MKVRLNFSSFLNRPFVRVLRQDGCDNNINPALYHNKVFDVSKNGSDGTYLVKDVGIINKIYCEIVKDKVVFKEEDYYKWLADR